jgi:L-malate glycosyltransferase
MQTNNKVLIAIPCLLLGGTEYQTLYHIKALNENGYAVTVLCYFEYNQTMVSYMREAGADVKLMTASGERPARFMEVFNVLFTGFRKALKEVRPDVIHVQYLAPGSLSILLFKLLRAKKVIVTAHVPGHIYRYKWIPQFIAKHLTESFLCVSKSSEEDFFEEEAQEFTKELFGKGRKHFTIYNCIETDISNSNTGTDHSTFNIQHSTFTLGIVSRLSHEKGIDVLISAMPMILKHNPNVKLLIVGEGAEKEKLNELAEKLKVSDAITWAGLQSKDSLAEFYSQMELVVVPSRFEGFGLTAIEAMNHGIPVVASAVDGLKEVIVDGSSGILFESEDSDALSKAIVDLIENDVKRNSLAEAGKKRVEEHFSYTIYQQKISELYEAMIGRKS